MDEEVPGQEKVVIMSDKLLDIKMNMRLLMSDY